MATGDIFSLRAIASPTGAIIRTVATLSINADTTPANSDRITTAHITFGALFSSRPPMRLGMPESMNSDTVPIVPASIINTFQLTADGISAAGRMPRIKKSAALHSATRYRHFGRAIIST